MLLTTLIFTLVLVVFAHVAARRQITLLEVLVWMA